MPRRTSRRGSSRGRRPAVETDRGAAWARVRARTSATGSGSGFRLGLGLARQPARARAPARARCLGYGFGLGLGLGSRLRARARARARVPARVRAPARLGSGSGSGSVAPGSGSGSGSPRTYGLVLSPTDGSSISPRPAPPAPRPRSRRAAPRPRPGRRAAARAAFGAAPRPVPRPTRRPAPPPPLASLRRRTCHRPSTACRRSCRSRDGGPASSRRAPTSTASAASPAAARNTVAPALRSLIATRTGRHRFRGRFRREWRRGCGTSGRAARDALGLDQLGLGGGARRLAMNGQPDLTGGTGRLLRGGAHRRHHPGDGAHALLPSAALGPRAAAPAPVDRAGCRGARRDP